MPPDNDQQPPDPENPQPPEGGTPPEPPETPEPPQGTKPSKVISMPTHAVAKIRQEERAAGQAAAKAEADKSARALGYSSYDDMLAKLKQKKGQPQRPGQPSNRPTGQPPQRANGNPDRNVSRLQRENDRLVEENRRLTRAKSGEEKRRKRTETELMATQAESELRVIAIRAGIQDVDYALHLMRQEIKGKDDSFLTKFDEGKFFGGLREKHSYLFGVETRPADTTPDTTKPNTPPTPPPKTPPPVDQTKSVKEMSPQQYQDHLRSLGITPPGVGLPG